MHACCHRQRIPFVVFLPGHVCPLQNVFLTAMRALDKEATLITSFVPVVNLRRAFDGRRADKNDLSVSEVLSSLNGKLQRVPFFRHAVAVHFVTKQDANRTGRKPRRRVRTDKGKVATGEVLHANCRA